MASKIEARIHDRKKTQEITSTYGTAVNGGSFMVLGAAAGKTAGRQFVTEYKFVSNTFPGPSGGGAAIPFLTAVAMPYGGADPWDLASAVSGKRPASGPGELRVTRLPDGHSVQLRDLTARRTSLPEVDLQVASAAAAPAQSGTQKGEIVYLSLKLEPVYIRGFSITEAAPGAGSLAAPVEEITLNYDKLLWRGTEN